MSAGATPRTTPVVRSTPEAGACLKTCISTKGTAGNPPRRNEATGLLHKNDEGLEADPASLSTTSSPPPQEPPTATRGRSRGDKTPEYDEANLAWTSPTETNRTQSSSPSPARWGWNLGHLIGQHGAATTRTPRSQTLLLLSTRQDGAPGFPRPPAAEATDGGEGNRRARRRKTRADLVALVSPHPTVAEDKGDGALGSIEYNFKNLETQRRSTTFQLSYRYYGPSQPSGPSTSLRAQAHYTQKTKKG
jgi:hypothetical protein